MVIPATFATFPNTVCAEVFAVMVEKPADPIIPGRFCRVNVSAFMTEATFAVIQVFIRRMWFGVELRRGTVGKSRRRFDLHNLTHHHGGGTRKAHAADRQIGVVDIEHATGLRVDAHE